VKRRQKIDVEERRLTGMVWHLFLLLPLIGVLAALAGAAETGHKRIMILHSAGREFRPWNEYARAIRAESFLKLSPDTKTIAIVNGDSPNERFCATR
jgi:hypothetical protein